MIVQTFQSAAAARTRGEGGRGAVFPRRRARREGFTLIEIMIASMILTLGLVGILALFPVAIRTGAQVVEDSNAVVIAQSVAEAIRESVRNRKRFKTETRTGEVTVYFVFSHDGVTDAIPPDSDDERPSHDYYILLPDFKTRRPAFQGRTERDQRVRAVEAGKTFVYPETDEPRNGRGLVALADDDGDDGREVIAGRDFPSVRVEKTYSLGNALTPGADASGNEARTLDDQVIEALKQYSYAFAISPSYFDADDEAGPRTFRPLRLLYHVRVMVYRGFVPPDESSAPPRPVHELDFEVAL